MTLNQLTALKMNKVLKKQGSNPSQFKLATRERLYVVFGEKKNVYD